MTSTKHRMSEAQKDMRRKHGTPEQFAMAVNLAADRLMVTTAEAEASIDKYDREWEEAGDSPAPCRLRSPCGCLFEALAQR